jgi:hypothetical protein
MLATGGSAIMAIESLESFGVEPKNIIFSNVVACPEGLKAMADRCVRRACGERAHASEASVSERTRAQAGSCCVVVLWIALANRCFGSVVPSWASERSAQK